MTLRVGRCEENGREGCGVAGVIFPPFFPMAAGMALEVRVGLDSVQVLEPPQALGSPYPQKHHTDGTSEG